MRLLALIFEWLFPLIIVAFIVGAAVALMEPIKEAVLELQALMSR